MRVGEGVWAVAQEVQEGARGTTEGHNRRKRTKNGHRTKSAHPMVS